MNSFISEGGERLRVFLDGTHVETRWIANYHVIWQTGQRNGPAEGHPARHTHCSAYVRGGGPLSRHIHPPAAESSAIASGERPNLLARRRREREWSHG